VIRYLNIIKESSGGSEPVSLEEVKAWLQIDFADFDDLLSGMITGARQAIESYTNLSIVDDDVTLEVETTCERDRVILPYALSVDQVTVKDVDGNTVSGCKLKGAQLKIGQIGEFEISYSASMDSVPEGLKEAIKCEVAERFSKRGENQVLRGTDSGASQGISDAAKAKANPYVSIWL
jgi:hypothetical protein